MMRRYPGCWVSLIALALQFGVVGANAAPTILHLIVGVESDLEQSLPAQCISRNNLFIGERERRTQILTQLSASPEALSNAIFGEAGHVSVDTKEFSLASIRAKLEAVKQSQGEGKLIFGLGAKHSVAEYLSLIGELERYDKERLSASKVYIDLTIAKWCNFSSPAFKPGTLSRTIWSVEVERKALMLRYFDLVAWYLSSPPTPDAARSEVTVPVVLYPERLFLFNDPPAASKIIADALSGRLSDIQGAVKTLSSGQSIYTGMTMFDSGDLQSRESMYTGNFLRARRLGIIVGNYMHDSDADIIHTVMHELGHYVGLPHVFTHDDTADAACSVKLNQESFAASFDTASLTGDALRKRRAELCECFFSKKDGKEIYVDYDARTSNVLDTSLAIIQDKDKNNMKVKYYAALCSAASDRYKNYFLNGETSRDNVMTYALGDERLSVERRGNVSVGQRKLALGMLEQLK